MTNTPSSEEARKVRSKRILVAGAVLAVLVPAGAVLGLSITAYIDRAIERRVDDALPKAIVAAVKDDPTTGLAIERRVRASIDAFIKNQPEKIAESLNKYIEGKRLDVAKQEDATLRSFAQEMLSSDGGPTVGPAAAPVSVAYFFDASCPYCRQMDPAIESLVTAGDVKIVYREIPILGPTSVRAARISGAAWQLAPDRWKAFHSALMGLKVRLDDATLDKVVMDIFGPDDAIKIAAAATADRDQQISKRIEANLDLAKRAGIHGTPFIMFSDGNFFRGAVPTEQIVAAVAKATRASGH